MLDDAPLPCNLAGEDVLYEITAPPSTQTIYVSIKNATDALQVSFENNSCGGTSCLSKSIPAGNTNIKFTAGAGGTYYIWVDALTTITYDISFGLDTGTVWVNIPDTRGNLNFETTVCSSPPFQNNKPFFQVSYNGIYKTNPMTLSPLFTTGTMCVTSYFKNTTGVEGVKKFDFKFNPLGYSSVIAADSIPGFYNSGYWILDSAGANFSYNFYDSLNTGRGDFTGNPKTCLKYEFCFDIIPVSNDTHLTNVIVKATSDGYGTGFSGYIKTGCCPVGYPNCLQVSGGSGSGGGGPQSFEFTFTDPPISLPVELVAFNAIVADDKVLLTWTTASETENDFYTVEKSRDGKTWTSAGTADGAGNSNIPLHYKFTDDHPLSGLSYYRLKQTDYNGDYSFSETRTVIYKMDTDVLTYPNPATDFITIVTDDITSCQVKLYTLAGKEIVTETEIQQGKLIVNTKQLKPGVYIIEIYKNGIGVMREKYVVQ